MLYLYPKKLDINLPKDNVYIILNRKTAERAGINKGDLVLLHLRGTIIGAIVMLTDTEVSEGEVGLPHNIWGHYPVSELEFLGVELLGEPKGMNAIRKKYKGQFLTYKDVYELMDDIVHFRLTPVQLTYFAALGYTIGFTSDELYYLTKAMVETGTTFDFSGLNKKIVDKHSIGGMPGKGITPIIVSILSSLGYLVPNTFSRAITTPAGTADVLETVMPVALNEKQIYNTIHKEGACLAWGGALDLAPADDILIQVEKPLRIESYDKFIISILAKKIAMGVKTVLIDIPYGEYGKVKERDLPLVKRGFSMIAKRFGMDLILYTRPAYGVDGRGIGPILEMKDTLLILERRANRPLGLENVALDMAGHIIYKVGDADSIEEGIMKAREVLDSGKALDKFWSIAITQGAKSYMTSEMLEPGIFNYQITTKQSGVIEYFNSHKIVQIARLLGTPADKGAGIYLEKFIGDRIKPGDLLATLYAEDKTRLELAKSKLKDIGEFVVVKQVKE